VLRELNGISNSNNMLRILIWDQNEGFRGVLWLNIILNQGQLLPQLFEMHCHPQCCVFQVDVGVN
jgi:hypothetical protein